MTPQGRRHHYVPRFLLNRFASRRQGKKAWIWQYSRDSDPLEISTRDAAVAKDFHGPPETTIESRVGRLESLCAPCLVSVDQGESLTEQQFETLRLLVWSLAVRTNALRQQFVRTYDDLLRELEDALARPDTADVIARYIKDNVDAIVADSLSDLPLWKRFVLRHVIKIRSVRQRALAVVDDHVNSGAFPSLLAPYFAAAREPANAIRAASEGQLRGLDGVLSENKPPLKFTPKAWSVQRHERLILADGCVVATAPDGRAGSLLRHSDEWRLCYLPISPTSVLVGHATEEHLALPPEELNPASAALSNRHFWASYYSHELAELSRSIGTGTSWFDAKEMSDLVDKGIQGLMDRG